MTDVNQVKSESIRFANKYDRERAITYYERFLVSKRKRFLNMLEQNMLKRGLAMAGHPTSILDIPAGTGRFWETLQGSADIRLHVADFNLAMLEVGFERRPDRLTSRLEATVASAFNLPFPDNSVDAIVSMRFIHHISDESDRMQLLRELARVTRGTVCISSWIEATGYRGQSRLAREKKRQPGKDYNKFVHQHAVFLKECEAAGFDCLGHTDLFPHVSPWRLYVLRKRQPLAFESAELVRVCPGCKGPLVSHTDGLICEQEKRVFPVKGKIPLLTQRDATTSILNEDAN